MPIPQYVLSITTAVAVLGLIVELLRRRQLKEKYAALWLSVGLVVAAVSLFPGLLGWAAGTANIQVPVNLLFFLALVLLLGVCIHLSWEASRLEERGRCLAEEVALLRLEVRNLSEHSSRDTQRDRV